MASPISRYMESCLVMELYSHLLIFYDQRISNSEYGLGFRLGVSIINLRYIDFLFLSWSIIF